MSALIVRETHPACFKKGPTHGDTDGFSFFPLLTDKADEEEEEDRGGAPVVHDAENWKWKCLSLSLCRCLHPKSVETTETEQK